MRLRGSVTCVAVFRKTPAAVLNTSRNDQQEHNILFQKNEIVDAGTFTDPVSELLREERKENSAFY